MARTTLIGELWASEGVLYQKKKKNMRCTLKVDVWTETCVYKNTYTHTFTYIFIHTHNNKVKVWAKMSSTMEF